MNKITAKALLKAYLYIMSLITLTAALFSGAYLIQAGSSYFAPINFSYTLYQANITKEMKEFDLEECNPGGEIVVIEENRYCWDGATRKEGLINGITIFISMTLLFLLHQLGIKKAVDTETPEWLIKGYTFISLMIYSITGVIAIPTAIYQTVNYFITKVGLYSTQYAPAYSIGLILLTLPLWYIFFRKTLKLKD